MSDRYILVNKKPKLCPDLMEWSNWYEKGNDNRRVAHTALGKTNVSTVFLGLDHSFGGGKPLLFETMIFGGKHDEYQERCSTWEEAEEMHKRAVKLAKKS